MFLSLVVFIVVVCASSGDTLLYHDSSDAYIASINGAQSTWTAGRNFPEDTTIAFVADLLGSFSSSRPPVRRNDEVIEENVTVPDAFDARTEWPECAEVIGHVSDQSTCRSAWAVATASAMSDRLCIHTNGEKNVILSAGNILSCCKRCGFQCFGGWTIEAWRYWEQFGVVSGGDYGTNEGCQAYPLPPCEHYGSDNATSCKGEAEDPVCYDTCDNTTSLMYEDELTFGVSDYWVYPNVTQLQLEIMLHGPVVATFLVYSDFVNYKSGIYVRVNDSIAYDSHAVKLLGWGSEDGVDYWLASNSWNVNWGDNGFFKILRGEDHCGIEGEVTAGMPNATYHM